MPIFLIERNFAEQLEMNKEIAAALKEVNDSAGVEWLISFLSADKKKTYCLYEAPSAEAIRKAAQQAGIPADSVIEVGELLPNGRTGAVQPERFEVR